MVIIVGALVLFGVFIYAVREVLNPFIALAVLFALLLPFRRSTVVKLVLGVSVALFVVWFANRLGAILTPFVISLLLAYLLDPWVSYLQTRRVPRTVTIVGLLVATAGVTTLFLLLLVPRVIEEIQHLLERTVQYVPQMQAWFDRVVLPFLAQLGIDMEKIKASLVEELPSRIQSLLEAFFKGALTATMGLSTVIGQILNVILTPILTFYFLRDYPSIRERVRGLIPPTRQAAVTGVLAQVDAVLSGYLRGQLLMCVIVGVLITLGLFVLGVQYSLLLGIITGVLNFIPTIGYIVSMVIGLLVALFGPSPLVTCVKFMGVFLSVQFLGDYILSPKVIGEKVGLPGPWMILAVLVFARFWGLVGLLIAVPTAALVKIFVENWYRNAYITKQATAGREPAPPTEIAKTPTRRGKKVEEGQR